MKKLTTIVSMAIMVALYFLVNLMIGPRVSETQDPLSGAVTLTPHAGYHMPLFFLFGALILAYLANGINIVDQWNRRPVMFFGKYVRTLGPGISWVEPLTYNMLSDINVQDTVIEVEAEEVQTKDNVGVGLVGVLTYCIAESNVRAAVLNVRDVYDSTLQRALSTLTDTTGTTDLDGLLEHRDNFCNTIAKTLGERVGGWGVTVKAFELKGFTVLDDAIAEAVAMKARAQKEGAAEVVRAQLQEQVTTALNTAAAAYTPQGRWLKGMETLIELARSANNNTIMIPTDLTESLAKLLPSAAQV
jgi:regulator of protease activity HflC (stomatin/prohibitin superfamily)